MLREARGDYYRKEVNKMKQPGIIPFHAIRNIKDHEKPKEWSIKEMWPELSGEEILENCADFFSEISNDFAPLKPDDLPSTYNRPIDDLDPVLVSVALSKMKTPKSIVSIDIPCDILKACADKISIALTPVINKIRRGIWWPKLWKSEEVSIIPKSTAPKSLDQTRNISCTSNLSKLTEQFMVEEIWEEIDLRDTQFGGRKNCGTDYLLAELTTKIMQGLDGGEACACVMSLDYSKAFNRMGHQRCLAALAEKGASNTVLGMVYSFLSDREMRVKIDGKFSSTRKTPGGAPQGTKSGNLLFSVAIDDMELAGEAFDRRSEEDVSIFRTRVPAPDESSCTMLYNTSADSFNIADKDGRLFKKHTHLDDTPPNLLLGAWDRDLIEEFNGRLRQWMGSSVGEFRYVDDQNYLEVALLKNSISTLTTGKEQRFIHAKKLNEKYILIDDKAKKLGMCLNLKKTQLLCVSGATSFDIKAYISVGGQVIESVEEIKILGYHIGNKPNANAQVAAIKKDCAKRSWSIRHLINAGVGDRDLVEIYKAFIRSVLDYSCVIYDGFLTKTQVMDLERIQSNILKTIFGFENSYRTCLYKAKVPTLALRRKIMFLKFAKRVTCNPMFAEKWLRKEMSNGYNLRSTNEIVERQARCDRLRNSPIFRIRRLLNEMNRKGKSFDEEIIKLKELADNIDNYDDEEYGIFEDENGVN